MLNKELLKRLNDEKRDLDIKINRLQDFRFTDEWKMIDLSQKYLLDIQLRAMLTYYECLVSRICNLLHERDKEKSLEKCEKTTKSH